MRWQLAVAPEVRPGAAGTVQLVHPATGACVTVPSAFADALPFAARPFTARSLLLRSGAALAPSAVEHAVMDLRAAGLVIAAATLDDRVARGAWNPVRLLAFPAVGLPLLIICATGVALQLQSILFFATLAAGTMRGALVIPFLVAVVVVPPARALFRAQVVGGGSVRARMRGVIPTWELDHPPPITRARRVLAHLSGFLFDALLINACVLAMRSKPFELGYGGLETPVAFLAVAVGMLVIAANPFAKYDAYFALEDLLDVADLRGHARARAFQLISRRRVDVRTALYAGYFVATVGYSLFISLGLLFIAYGVSSRLFPADAPLRIGLASFLVAVVLWRAVLTVHRPLLRAFAARNRKAGEQDKDAGVNLTLPAATATVTTSLHPLEGFPFGTMFMQTSDEHTHDFSALASSVAVHVVARAALVSEARHLDLDAPSVRTLSLRMFAQPPRALNDDARAVLAMAHAVHRELPLERYEPMELAIIDGTFKHGALDIAARMRSASELDVYRALFAPLRSRHVVERDRVLAFRDKAVDRFSHFVLIDDNDDAGAKLRLRGLTRVLDRAPPPSSSSSSSGTALDVLHALTAQSSPAQQKIAAQWRKTSPALLDAGACVPVLFPVDVARLPEPALSWALSAGLVFAETRAGKTSLQSQIRHPTLVIPTGPEGHPTGLKLRVLHTEPFHAATRVFSPDARYEFLSPRKNFLGAAASDVDARELPIWLSAGGAGDTVFVFDGELKAIACRHLLGQRAISAGGFNHPWQQPLAKLLAKEPSVTFVVDAESPVYRRGRTDQLQDPIVRTLQLAWRTRALNPSARLLLMRGLSVDDKKLDLDEVAGLSSSARDQKLREFRAHTADVVDAAALTADAGAYLSALCAFSDRFYAALASVKAARAQGRGAEVRDVAAALLELHEQRKQLLALAGHARDVVHKALRPRRSS